MRTQMDYKVVYEILKENEQLKEENKRLKEEVEFFKNGIDELRGMILTRGNEGRLY